MGELVAVMAASHAPNLLLELGKEWTDFMDLHYSMMPGGNAERPSPEAAERFAADVRRTFGLLREVVEAARPDALLLVANDQFVNFFYNNVPTFCLGVSARRPAASSPATPSPTPAPSRSRAHLLAALVDEGFDLAFSEKLELEHTQIVPLYFVLPARRPDTADPPVREHLGCAAADAAPLPCPRRRARARHRRERRAGGDPGDGALIPGRPKIGQVDVDFDRPLLEQIQRGDGARLADYTVAAARGSGQRGVPELDSGDRRGGRCHGPRSRCSTSDLPLEGDLGLERRPRQVDHHAVAVAFT